MMPTIEIQSITLNDFILSNDSAIPLTPPICNYIAPDSNTNLIADTGCSGHYDAYNIDTKNVPVVTPVNVLLPNGSHMSSTHTNHLSMSPSPVPSNEKNGLTVYRPTL